MTAGYRGSAVPRTSVAGLLAVDELGGSAPIGEMVEAVVKRERFTDDQQAVVHNDGPETEIGYRLAWARTYLNGMDRRSGSLSRNSAIGWPGNGSRAEPHVCQGSQLAHGNVPGGGSSNSQAR